MALRRLRLRSQPEMLPNEVRPRRQAAVRWVYFGTILLLALWLGDLFLGGFFYLRSEGQVRGESAVIAAEFTATVRDIRVQDGERVAAGQVVAVVSSQSDTESLARVTAEQADRAVRLGELRIRGETITAVIGLARNRQAVATETRGKLELLLARGFLPFEKRTAAIETEFRSRQDLAQLAAEQGAATAQVEGMAQAVAETDDAIAKLRGLYDGGVLRAPISGIVGRRLTENGAVLAAGQPLLELYKDARFIIAFLPTGGLFLVLPGDRVVASTGLQTFTGTIASIEPVAALLPGEFQRAFAPVDRQQLIRIAFDPGQAPPPLFTKVQVRSALSWGGGGELGRTVTRWWRS